MLIPELEKYKKKEGSCWCQELGRFHPYSATQPYKHVLHVSGLREGVRYAFWPQSLYHLFGVGSRADGEKERKVEKRLFGLNSCTVFFCLIQSKSVLLLPSQSPNSIAIIQRNSCISHFHCVFAFRFPLFFSVSHL